MVIPALAVLASSLLTADAPPLRLVAPKKAFAAPMFQPPLATGRSVGLRLSQPQLPTSEARLSFKCHIIVIRPDPGIDPKMAIEAPAMDPKIARRSVCAEPDNE